MTEADDELSDDERFDVVDGYYMVPGVEQAPGAAEPTTIRVQEVPNRKTRPSDEELIARRVFTDHMALVDWDERTGWTDPRVVPCELLMLHPASAVFHTGQAVTENLKAFRGVDGQVRLFRADLHCRHMANKAKRLCMPAIDPVSVQALLKQLVGLDRDWIPSRRGNALDLRLSLIATESVLATRSSKRFLFFVVASPGYLIEGNELLPMRVWVEEHDVRAFPGASPAASLRATDEAKVRGYDRVLWTTGREHRQVEDLGTMNLVVVLADEVVTPGLDGAVLDGVTRDSVLALCHTWGLRVRERSVTIGEILDAESSGHLRELLACGPPSVIAPIAELGWRDRRVVINESQPGQLARRLFETITDIQYGRAPDPDGWLTPID